MKSNSSRREFLSAGLALPVAGLASAAGFGKATGQSSPAPSPASTPKLTYRTLGKTGLRVTTVAFGPAATSDPSVIERALDMGLNYFDTARAYQGGNNERMVGAVLNKKRKDVILSSKSTAGTKQDALNDLDTSLRELRTDYLDVWHLHGKDKTDVPDELFEAQQIAKKQGKTRFAGVSTHNAKDMIPYLVKKGSIDVIMAAYNFTMDKRFGFYRASGSRALFLASGGHSYEKKEDTQEDGPSIDALIGQAGDAGVGLVVMKALAGGFRGVKPDNPLYPKIKSGGTMLAALKWALKHPGVSTVVTSITDMDELEEDVKAMAEPYSQVDEKLLARRLEQIGSLYCRMCGACEGACAKGLPVANLLRYLTYADGYGQFSLGREHFLALPAEVTSVRCKDCASCTVTCPFGVKVSSRLACAQELFA
jgi:predicted aldo/keto reductase-like oxidoreductase